MTLLALAMPASPAGAAITPEWDAAFGRPDADAGYDVEPTSDGGYTAAGFGGQGNLLANLVVKTGPTHPAGYHALGRILRRLMIAAVVSC